MTENGFSLALEKTEVVILTRKKVSPVHPNQVGEIMVLLKLAAKYHSIIIHTKISFVKQIRNTIDNAAARIFAICRLMVNVGDHLPSRHSLLMSGVQSVLLYSFEV